MIHTVYSINGILIRLTDELWAHIVEEHPEMHLHRSNVLDAIATPDSVYEGNSNEFLAVIEYEPQKYIIAVYKEIGIDVFIFTAFFSRKTRYLKKRKKLWERQK